MRSGITIGFARVRWKILVILMIVMAALFVALFLNRTDGCPAESVLHPPAGTCINPRALVVTGSFEDVSNAVSELGGRILFSSGSDHLVRVPAEDLDDLDRTKDALDATGFKVRHAVTGSVGL